MIIGIPLGMALSLGIALLLNLEIKGVAVWRTFFYLPSIMPVVASSILWLWIFNPNAGMLNAFLASFGVHGPNWLQDENTSKPALILMGLWSAGGGMIIWLAGLKGNQRRPITRRPSSTARMPGSAFATSPSRSFRPTFFSTSSWG